MWFFKIVCFSNLCKEKMREKQTVNMPRQFFHTRKDGLLSFENRKYPYLFDISNAGYKEKDRVKNAWKKIDNSLGVGKGITSML